MSQSLKGLIVGPLMELNDAVVLHFEEAPAQDILGENLFALREKGTGRSLVLLALIADVLRVVETAAPERPEADDELVIFAADFLQVAARTFAKKGLGRYGAFGDGTSEDAARLLAFHREDAGTFGGSNERTHWGGLAVCRNVDRLLGDTGVLDRYEQMVSSLAEALLPLCGGAAEQTDRLERLRTFIGESCTEARRPAAGDRSDLDAERAALDAERAALNGARAALGEERAALEAERAAVDEERAALDAERAALHEQRSAFDEERERSAAERTALEVEREPLAADRAALDADRTRLEEERSRLAGDRDSFEAERAAFAAECESQRGELSAERAELADEFHAFDAERAEVEAQRADLAAREAALAAEREQMDAERESLASAREGIASEQEPLAAERTALDAERQRLPALEAELQDRQLDQQARQTELDSAQAELATARAAHDGQREELDRHEQSLAGQEASLLDRERGLDEQTRDLNSERSQLEAERQELKAQREQLADERLRFERQQTDAAQSRDKSAADAVDAGTERQRLQADRDELSALQEQLRTEQDYLDAAHRELDQSQQRLRADASEIERQRAELTAEAEQLRAEARRLEGESARWQAEHQRLEAERAALAASAPGDGRPAPAPHAGSARLAEARAALWAAAAAGDVAQATAALEAGADVNSADSSRGWQTPLLLAARHGHATVVELLLEGGGNSEACDSTGRNALVLAVEGGFGDVAGALLGRGEGTVRQAQQRLSSLLRDRNATDTARELALKSLATLGRRAQDAVPAVIGLLQSKSRAEARAAAEALARIDLAAIPGRAIPVVSYVLEMPVAPGTPIDRGWVATLYAVRGDLKRLIGQHEAASGDYDDARKIDASIEVPVAVSGGV